MVTLLVALFWATEHSVATVWGKDNEVEYLRAQLYKGDVNLPVSIVIDSAMLITLLRM